MSSKKPVLTQNDKQSIYIDSNVYTDPELDARFLKRLLLRQQKIDAQVIALMTEMVNIIKESRGEEQNNIAL